MSRVEVGKPKLCTVILFFEQAEPGKLNVRRLDAMEYVEFYNGKLKVVKGDYDETFLMEDIGNVQLVKAKEE